MEGRKKARVLRSEKAKGENTFVKGEYIRHQKSPRPYPISKRWGETSQRTVLNKMITDSKAW
jgi:hypothetical protein